ncbi:rac-beta serine/threonine protein kinase, putative [Plasmodium relictum]|uniref:non-specific serine/threonine protein kinase n=1 Tax=Plasmodium relictum TaxID=85471 RepID=A0A1J1HGB5_PLARL|nr:rac-beta serine/threonine protein kinase, putative [Plasmodium relictum]CRH02885.1 rac-beta serine/threonine protein kinase, putative [Plasmodium relictum]
MNHINFFRYFSEKNRQKNIIPSDESHSIPMQKNDFKKYFNFIITKKKKKEKNKDKINELNNDDKVFNESIVNTFQEKPLMYDKNNDTNAKIIKNRYSEKSKQVDAMLKQGNKYSNRKSHVIEGTKLLKIKEYKNKKGKLYKILFLKKNNYKNEKREDILKESVNHQIVPSENQINDFKNILDKESLNDSEERNNMYNIFIKKGKELNNLDKYKVNKHFLYNNMLYSKSLSDEEKKINKKYINRNKKENINFIFNQESYKTSYWNFINNSKKKLNVHSSVNERNDYISKINKKYNFDDKSKSEDKKEKIFYKDNMANCTLNRNNKLMINDECLYKHDEDEELRKRKLRKSVSLTNEKKKKMRPESFIFLKVIGKGSYGKVLLVKHVQNNKLYAMKILRKENIISKNQLEHTKIERNVLKCVSHPFIVKLYYAFQTSKKLYFILEYCPGGELFFHLSKLREFSEEVAKFYSSEIILALQYLHNLNIIYRDLKPENVLLDELGHIRLTDFGLSKEGITDNNSAKSLCGTPEYLAPEIIEQVGHGKAVDWWSLGIMIYEMLTGNLPFNSSNRSVLFERIKYENLTYPKNISPTAIDLLKKLFEKNPNKRLGSGVTDAEEIKRHPFFKSVNWDDVLNKKVKPPFKPPLFNQIDLQNFDKEFLCMPLRYSDQFDTDPMSSSQKNNIINNFNYNNYE